VDPPITFLGDDISHVIPSRIKRESRKAYGYLIKLVLADCEDKDARMSTRGFMLKDDSYLPLSPILSTNTHYLYCRPVPLVNCPHYLKSKYINGQSLITFQVPVSLNFILSSRSYEICMCKLLRLYHISNYNS
jgi:hypothetical protein